MYSKFVCKSLNIFQEDNGKELKNKKILKLPVPFMLKI